MLKTFMYVPDIPSQILISSQLCCWTAFAGCVCRMRKRSVCILLVTICIYVLLLLIVTPPFRWRRLFIMRWPSEPSAPDYQEFASNSKQPSESWRPGHQSIPHPKILNPESQSLNPGVQDTYDIPRILILKKTTCVLYPSRLVSSDPKYPPSSS